MKLKWERAIAGHHYTGNATICRCREGWVWIEYSSMKTGTKPTLKKAKKAVEEARKK